MIRRIICAVLMAILTITASAQNAQQAKAVLDKTASIVGNKNGATAQFTITSAKTGNVSGSLSIKGNMFLVTTPQSTVWYNGKTQWTYMKSTEEVNVSTPNASQQLQMNPYRFINMYRTGYNLALTDKGQQYWIHLTAQSAKSNTPEMYILVNKKTYHPETVKMKQGNSWMTVKIRNFKACRLANSIFTFKAKDYPQAEVIDLR